MRERNFKRILFPTDLTKADGGAIKYAVSLAAKYSSKLYILHVVNTKDTAAGFYVPHISFEGLDKEMKKAAEEMLKKFTNRFVKHFKNYETEVVEGVPYKEIIKFAKNTDIGLIVMDASGATRMERAFFGSVTERVMRTAGKAVLIVPPEENP